MLSFEMELGLLLIVTLGCVSVLRLKFTTLLFEPWCSSIGVHLKTWSQSSAQRADMFSVTRQKIQLSHSVEYRQQEHESLSCVIRVQVRVQILEMLSSDKLLAGLASDRLPFTNNMA